MATTEDATERRNGIPAGTPPAETAPPGPAEYVPLPEAARRLGISGHAVRRQLRAGQLRGRREETPQGYRWMILLATDPPGAGVPDAQGVAGYGAPVAGTGAEEPQRGAAHDVAPPGASDDGWREAAGPSDGATRQAAQGDATRNGTAPAELVASQRAREMAEYTATRLAPLHARLEELSRNVGRLQTERDAARAELEQARLQLSEWAEAIAPEVPPPPESAPAPPALSGAGGAGADRPWWRRAWAWVTADQDDRAPAGRPAA